MSRLISSILTITLLVSGFTAYRLFRAPHKKKSSISLSALADKKNIIPVAVIGAGPAGLSAALYTGRGGRYTVVFAGKKPGGQLMGTTYVENWPAVPKALGPAIMQGLQEQIREFGVVQVNDTIVDIDTATWPYTLTTEDGRIVHALSIVAATGSSPKKLEVPGEQEYWGNGVTTCAICDAPYYKEKTVVVVGGGDSAAEEALQLVPFADKIYVFVRGDKMRAAPFMQERLAQHTKIEVMYQTHIVKINGDGKHVTNVEIIQNNQKPRELPVAGVFLAIGHTPNTQLFTPFLKHTPEEYIITHAPTQHTSVDGIFAGGEVTADKFQHPSYRQAGIAAGDGIRAGLDADKFLHDIGIDTAYENKLERQFFEVYKQNMLEVEEITTLQEFEDKVLKAKQPVIVDFYATYCPSCMQMMPAVKEVAAAFDNRVTFIKVNSEVAKAIAEKQFVSSLPVLLGFKNGAMVVRYNQAMSKKELSEFAQMLLDK